MARGELRETATEEIEQTLALARLEQDRSLSRVRTFIAGALFLLSIGVRVAMNGTTVAAHLYLAAYFLLAVGLDLYASKTRPRRTFGWITHAADLIAVALFAPLVVFATHSPEQHAEAMKWLMPLLPAAMLLSMVVVTSRGEPLLSLFGGLLATALVVPIVIHYDGFHQSILYLGLLMLMAGIAGMMSARRARRMLSTLVRLQLLRRFLPEAASEQVLADPHSAFATGGQTLTVTVMVTDLRNFTSMSERSTPAEVVSQLNAYHAAMLEQVEFHGGMLDKFMGDGELIVFGLLEGMGKRAGRGDSGAHAAVSCARAMRKALIELNEERARQQLPPLAIGIGIHTGEVVAGNIGAPGRRLEFTVIGDAVNTASRLESATKQAGREVIVSASTVGLLADRTGLSALEPMQLRGKSEPLPVFAM